MSARTRLVVFLITLPVIVFALVGGVLAKVWAGETTFQHLRVFEDVVSLISGNYVEEVNLSRVMRGAMRGLAEGLDADSAYLSAEDVKSLEGDQAARAADVGLELTRQYYLRVIASRENSPAAKAGLRSGDFIRAIDGRPTREMSAWEGSRLLKGEAGTKVSLLVIRGNAADPHTVELVREMPQPPAVTGRIHVNDIGYIRITGFGPGVPAALTAKVSELSKSGARRLLLDVRDAAEGTIDAGYAAARLLVSSGTLGHREVKGETREAIPAGNTKEAAITMPAVVLVNTGSSGAAEVFAAALSGNGRAELVGERTHGRAGIQRLVRLNDGAAMLITNGWYLTPKGDQIHQKGITPAVSVEGPEVDFGATPGSDPIFDKGVERLVQAK